MCMMHLVHRWLSLQPAVPTTVITVLTVDHQLRSQSWAEAEFVADAALALGFKHQTLTWDEPKPKSGLQNAARTARYSLMLDYCNAHGVEALLTAHTEDDQAETFIMRLKRGSGVDGLSGIAEVSMQRNVAILRPLLAISKAQIIRHCAAHKIAFVTDPGNQNASFERIAVRQNMLLLRKVGLRQEVLARSATRLHRGRQALKEFTEDTLRQAFTVSPLGLGTLKRDAFDKVPEEIKIRLLARVLGLIGGNAQPAESFKIERLALKLSEREIRTALGGCRIVAVDEHSIAFIREHGRMRNVDLALPAGGSCIWDRRVTLCMAEPCDSPATIRPLGSMSRQSMPDELRAALRQKSPLDRLAALASPAILIGTEVMSVPLLGWKRDPAAPHVRASFVPQSLPYINDT